MTRRIIIALVLVGGLAVAAVASACGGNDSASSDQANGHGMDRNMEQPGTAANPDVVIDLAVEKLKFVPETLAIPTGRTVMIRFENRDGGVEHDFVIEGLDAEIMSEDMQVEHGGGNGMVALHTVSGETARIVFRTTQQGTFDIYCTIAGHRAAGMEGKVTVS